MTRCCSETDDAWMDQGWGRRKPAGSHKVIGALNETANIRIGLSTVFRIGAIWFRRLR